ncbi:MAG TPA: DUF2262 domain-containing protein [Verrucomicrobiae bacterium]
MTTPPHDYFGSMKLDERRRCYHAVLNVSPDRKVRVIIDWMGATPAEALKRSQEICERLRVREPEYRRKIASDLLRLYNDNWRDGETLDADGFMRRISLSDISIGAADFDAEYGCASVSYSDGDLFAGHSIDVTLDADLNYVKSQIAG